MRHAVAVLLLCLVASPAAAQLDDRNFRVAANASLGFAGEVDAYLALRSGGTTNHSRYEDDLDVSAGFDLRGELPVLDFLVIGAWFEFLSIEAQVPNWAREETFSFDAFARLRWVFELGSGVFLEPYALLPLGLTLAPLPPGGMESGDDVWVGWNTAALGGAQLLHESGFGGYVEIGWRHVEVYRKETATILGASVEADGAYVTNELALNLGFVYAFGH